MKIRNAEITDLPRIMEIYAYAREYMAANGNPNQWGPTNWPPEDLIREDIRQRHSYVCEEDGRILGAFFYDSGMDIEPTYRIIEDGEWESDEPYGVVHRIASDGTVRGVGLYCLNWAFDQCGHMRADTHPDNVIMQNLLTKAGFEKRGIIHVVEDSYPRYAYEKLKESDAGEQRNMSENIEYLDIVDEKGNPTGKTIERSVAHSDGVPHRTSHVWILRRKNGRTEILLQKRAAVKSFPGCYDISSAGHIPAGDDYVESAIRELQEELGVTAGPDDLVCCGDRYIVWDDVFFGKPYHDRQYTRVFLMWLDREEDQFNLQEEEVDGVRWMDLEQCIEGVRAGSFENCIEPDELMMVLKTSVKETSRV